MRSDIDLVLDLDRCGVSGRSLRPPVEVRKDRSSHTDRAVVAYADSIRMDVIDIDLLTEPHALADSDPPEPVERWPHAAAAWADVSDLLQEPLNEGLREHDSANDTPFDGATAAFIQA